MPGLHEVELRIAVAEGILSREDADALAEEARMKRQSPLALLVERGQLSEESFASLRAEVQDDTARLGAELGEIHVEASPPDARELDTPAFPVPAWDRYMSLGFLGQGGMGKVFLARDPRLRREVAIKFVHGDSPEQVRRLIAEARAQARVSHERVCQVHEVGEVEGKVYIAMQYIAGKPLGALAGELTVEQKVMLVRGAAEGIHEAHRAGIIHRDLKPSNIMVERGDDGALRPYVMDFGLARSVRDDGATLSGAVLGTPRYMAPEQAHGEAAKLDRRADVYSLGATLYHLLTGAPPIPGGTALEVIHNLVTTEPRAPRALDPDIPADLEAIVMKCLEKDRSARYDSARALAEDLGRFLNGEPVLARAAGAWYRLRKRLAKHRRLVTASAAVLVVLMVAVGWGIQTRREANERERLARRFTEQVEHIEAMARYSALSPAHDIRGDRAAIHAQIAELEGEIRQAGAVAAGPGHYALGRGHLALGDDERAAAELAEAWERGYREPRVAYALAVAEGHLYQQALREAARLPRELREERRHAVERRYRDPVLTYLRESRGADMPSLAYVAALVAYYEERFDDALGSLDVIDGRPAGLAWFYEAPLLRGEILYARANARRGTATPVQTAADLAAGRRALAAAAAIGRSDPAVHMAQGELEFTALGLEIYGGGEVAAPFDRGVEAARRALALLPDDLVALALRVGLLRHLAEYRGNRGEDVTELLTRAVADARRAVELAPSRREGKLALAHAYRQWGEFRHGRSEDPSEQLREAVEVTGTIAPGDRDYELYVLVGLTHKVWADYQDQSGQDSESHRSLAIAAYADAIRISDQRSSAWLNLGINYYARASQPRSQEPDADLARALEALDKGRAIDPRSYVPCFYEGEVLALLAQRKQALGVDPEPERARAIEMYRQGLAINPRLPHLYNGISIVQVQQARDASDHGRDPTPLLDEAQAAAAQAVAVAPEQGYGYSNLGDVLAQRAAYERARGRDPQPIAREAAGAFVQALERIPAHPTILLNLASIHTLVAAYELDQSRDPRDSLALARRSIDRALARDPTSSKAKRLLAETSDLEARWRARSSGRTGGASSGSAQPARRTDPTP